VSRNNLRVRPGHRIDQEAVEPPTALRSAVVDEVTPWLRTATQAAVVRRALLTSILVGSVLVLINHADALIGSGLSVGDVLPIALTYAVPYVVSTASSVAAARGQARLHESEHEARDHAIESLSQVPGQNPNPVLRLTRIGRLVYANASSAPLLAALGIEVGGDLPADLVEELLAAAKETPPRAVERSAGIRTFAWLPIEVPDLDLINLYGTDVTAEKVVERFPGRNPNPVMRMSYEGRLIYANEASGPIVRALGIADGSPFPAEIADHATDWLAGRGHESFEFQGEGRWFAITPVPVPEFEFINLYGTDITARKAVDRFPDSNPNPVLRVSRAGLLTYANPASEPIRRALRVDVGQPLPAAFFERVQEAVWPDASDTLEVSIDGRVFELLVVSLYEFESINLYGTEVTAARQVAAANRENERLLLNILPPSIADRLRRGEVVIADRFDEMTVLFADCVRFTELSSHLSPTELVALLNDVFSLFDRLADRYGLEKVKTIGDAYMVVGGLAPDPDRADHVARVADMALDMLDEVEAYRSRTGSPLEIRIGAHLGPTVAGVIGLKKFIYDVWGDAVNMASRMESQGEPGRIQVSTPMYDRLAHEFAFEPRGTVEIKGKGPMATYFLTGRKARGNDSRRRPPVGLSAIAEADGTGRPEPS
jgi:class 3 adenylate cyclase